MSSEFARFNIGMWLPVSAAQGKVIVTTVRGAVVEDVRTVFERKDDTTIYIPVF